MVGGKESENCPTWMVWMAIPPCDDFHTFLFYYVYVGYSSGLVIFSEINSFFNRVLPNMH